MSGIGTDVKGRRCVISWDLHSFLGICLWGDLAVDSRKQPKGMMESLAWAKGDEAHALTTTPESNHRRPLARTFPFLRLSLTTLP